MDNAVEKKRCAIYTRKSVEDGLEMEFNSLDAQRAACEAYVISQMANGWICLPEHYDDGGVSGGTLDRPALKKLLDDAKNGLIDIIVIYKIDRLSRSICDFAELSKKFDEWGVSFVSVTQEINTSTSAGRMMLNILITFAQYEREVIAERIRDKMSASRKRGQWVGGTVPFGYRRENRRIVPDPEKAKVVVTMYEMFLKERSSRTVAFKLNKKGIKNARGNAWKPSSVIRTLNNHTYVGDVFYKGEVYPGEHEAIISRETWDAAQELMKCNSHSERGKTPVPRYAQLKGVIRCGHCNCAMSPTHSSRWGRMYFYYRCAADTQREVHTCPIRIIPAGEIEKAVVKHLGLLFSTPSFVAMASALANLPVAVTREAFKDIDGFWNDLIPKERDRLIELLVETVTVREDGIDIKIKTEGMRGLIKELQEDDND